LRLKANVKTNFKAGDTKIIVIIISTLSIYSLA